MVKEVEYRLTNALIADINFNTKEGKIVLEKQF